MFQSGDSLRKEENSAAVVKGEDVVGAFFEDGWFGGYGACGGLRRREEMDVCQDVQKLFHFSLAFVE